ncbi:MAG: hypothetical protein WD426_06895 [Anditalea sp.]
MDLEVRKKEFIPIFSLLQSEEVVGELVNLLWDRCAELMGKDRKPLSVEHRHKVYH